MGGNKFVIGEAGDIWSKLEPTPFPHAANILENKALFETQGHASFELDVKTLTNIKSMTNEERSIILRYLVDRVHAIIEDPSKAYPPTKLHKEAKEKLQLEAGGAGEPVLAEADDHHAQRDRLHLCGQGLRQDGRPRVSHTKLATEKAYREALEAAAGIKLAP